MKQQAIDEMFLRSKGFVSDDPLTAFLYALIRDHLTVGQLESIMQEQVEDGASNSKYTNGWVARYAQDVAERIRSQKR